MSSINGVDDRKSKKVDDKNVVEQNLNEKILYFYFLTRYVENYMEY